jgi:hypothetical protein
LVGHLMAQGRHSNGSCLSLFTFLVVCFYFLFQTTFFCVYRSFFRCLDYTSRDLVYFAAEIDINVFVYTPFSSFCIFEYAYYLHSTRLYSYGRKMRKIRKYGYPLSLRLQHQHNNQTGVRFGNSISRVYPCQSNDSRPGQPKQVLTTYMRVFLG